MRYTCLCERRWIRGCARLWSAPYFPLDSLPTSSSRSTWGFQTSRTCRISSGDLSFDACARAALSGACLARGFSPSPLGMRPSSAGASLWRVRCVTEAMLNEANTLPMSLRSAPNNGVRNMRGLCLWSPMTGRQLQPGGSGDGGRKSDWLDAVPVFGSFQPRQSTVAAGFVFRALLRFLR